MVLFRFFFGLKFDKKFQPFKNHINNEVLGCQEFPDNTLIAYKGLQMSYKSYYNQQEPLNKNQSKLAKKPRTPEKKPKKKSEKTIPKFAVVFEFGAFRVTTPPPPPPPPPPPQIVVSIITLFYETREVCVYEFIAPQPVHYVYDYNFTEFFSHLKF